MADPVNNEATTTGPADPLLQHLATSNAPCPTCGYNMRGMTSPRCPECGTAVRLTLCDAASARGARTQWMFLLLAFGWLLVSGSMNTTRNIQQVRWQLEAATTYQVTASRLIIQRGGAGGGPVQVVRVPGSGASPGLGVVDWMTWVRLGWSGTLAVGAAVGLFMLWLLRRRSIAAAAGSADSGGASATAWGPRLVVYAWSLFALYAGWHVWLFLGEMIG